MNEKRERRSFSDEFKHQIVALYNAGKPRSEICREYGLIPAVVDQADQFYRFCQRVR